MKISLITACAPFFASSPAIAQVAGMAAPTATVGATLPPGTGVGSGAGGTGVPLGAREITSPGVNPLPTVAPAAGAATACNTAGTAPSTTYGSNATYDDGGLSLATSGTTSVVTPGAMSSSTSSAASARLAMPTTTAMIDTSGLCVCSSGTTNPAISSIPTSIASGSGRGTGILLGSTELSDLGISTSLAVPAPIAVPMATPAVETNPIVPATSSPSSATVTSSRMAFSVP
jgi:hypothetical protein